MRTPSLPPATSLLDDLRALPRPFWVLFAGTFINRFGTFVWPFLTIYLTRQGHSLTAAACAISAFGVGSFGGSAFGGWLSDHLGRRHTIVFGSTAAACFLMLLYAAGTMPMILLCAVLTGFASGTYHPAASALLSDVVPEPLRVRAYATFRLAANAGFAFGAATAGVLANWSFFWLFAGDAFTTLMYSGIALCALPHGLRGQTRQAPWRVAIAHIRGDRAFHAQFVASFCAAIVFAQFGSTYSVYVTHAGLHWHLLGWHLAPESIYGLLIGWNGIMVMICELPLTGLTQRLNPRRTMAVGYLLLGCGFASNAIGCTLPLLFLAMTVFTAGEIISTPVSSAYVSRLAPEAMRGRYMGVLALAWNGAGIAGPLLGSLLYQLAPNAIWATCAALGATSAVVILRSGRIPALPDDSPAVAGAHAAPVLASVE